MARTSSSRTSSWRASGGVAVVVLVRLLLLLPLPLLPQSHFPPKPKPTTTNSFDRRVDGTYLRQPPIKELVALSAELHDLASLVPQPSTTPEHSTTAALRMFDEWIVKGKTEREYICIHATSVVLSFTFCFFTCNHNNLSLLDEACCFQYDSNADLIEN